VSTFELTDSQYDDLLTESDPSRPVYNRLQEKVVSDWLEEIKSQSSSTPSCVTGSNNNSSNNNNSDSNVSIKIESDDEFEEIDDGPCQNG
jgi:hypothetical protein